MECKCVTSKNGNNVALDYGAYNEGGYNAWPTAVPNPAGGTTNFAVMIGAAHALEMPFFFGNWGYLIAPKHIFREDN